MIKMTVFTQEWLEERLRNNTALSVHDTERKARETVRAFEETQKPSKYRNTRVKVAGIPFDSIKESRYFEEIQLMLKAGEISGFILQPKFLLQEGDDEIKPIYYIADFLIFYMDGVSEIWDIKPGDNYTTDVYKLKKKMFHARYPNLQIIEKY